MDNKENSQLEISLHYYLEDKGLHQMNAFIRNKCEKHLLMALKQLFSYYRDCPIDVRVHKEGGLIDDYILLLNMLSDGTVQYIFNTLITAFATYYFTKRTNRLTDAKERLDLLEDIKSSIKKGSLSKDQAMLLVGSDRKLKKLMNDFFKELENEQRATAIELTYRIPCQEPKSELLDLKDSDYNFNGSRNITKYIVNDEEYLTMRGAVKRCFEIYIEGHPDMTAEEIVNVWLSLRIQVSNLVENERSFHSRTSRTKFTYSDEFVLNNGERIYTSNHYSFKSFCSFMDKVNKQNWGIRIKIM